MIMGDPPDVGIPCIDPPEQLQQVGTKCSLCGHGDNSTHHWTLFCPVIFGALSLLIGRVAYPQDLLAQEQDSLNTAIRLIHVARRELVALNAFSHGKYGSPQHTPSQQQHIIIAKFAEATRNAQPFGLGEESRFSTFSSKKNDYPAEKHCTQPAFGMQLGVHTAMRRKARALQLITSIDIAEGHEVLATHNDKFLQTGLREPDNWLPPPTPGPISEANVIASVKDCLW